MIGIVRIKIIIQDYYNKTKPCAFPHKKKGRSRNDHHMQKYIKDFIHGIRANVEAIAAADNDGGLDTARANG